MRSAKAAAGWLAVFAAIGSTVLAQPAVAELGPIQLVSKSATEQADLAVEPALSADGRYVAFCGQIGGRQGVFRKALADGAIAPVATRPVGAISACPEEGFFAKAPSLSADGRYVSFLTPAPLDAANDGAASDRDVYVADMSTSPPSYELASSLDGCDPSDPGGSGPCGLVYEGGGALVAGRVALSADGRRVAFVTAAKSNLGGASGDTPAGQVLLRDLEADRTVLVSEMRDPLSGEIKPGVPVPGGATPISGIGAGAALSADGSTVAWVGSHLPDQVPMLADEEQKVRQIDAETGGAPNENAYHEPLWRRLSSVLQSTRRMIGGGDPLAPGCPPGGTLADPPCQGPYPDLVQARERTELTEEQGGGWGRDLPMLSADGKTVALLGSPDEDGDLFLVDMTAGMSRREAVRRLTRWTNPAPGVLPPTVIFERPEYTVFTGPIRASAISADGTRIAFTTVRQRFSLAPPTLISPIPSGFGLVDELYQVDLVGETIERVTPGTSADVSLGGSAASPSYGAAGSLLAFGSAASNLVSGDANGAGDAFVIEVLPGAPPGDSAISAVPPRLVTQPRWSLSASAVSRPDGSVRVLANVPGEGTLRARAASRLGRDLRNRKVATGRRRAPAARLIRLELRLPPGLRGLAREPGGLYTTIRVSFSGPGGKSLHEDLVARFRAHEKAKERR